jgi:3-hydroxyacyl-CoA dehydrogenase
MNKRIIRRVAIIGSGIMGSRIACHYANIGVNVLLLDIAPSAPTPAEEKAGLSLTDKKVRNRIVNDALQSAIKSNPAPLYASSYASRISTGNLDDDLHRISDCDWVMEVVVENLAVKKQLFERIEQFRKPGTIISSNTSGIPIHMMSEGRSDDFQKHFIGTHFFNPPRYLRLLEIIPGPKTDPAVIDFALSYGSRYLGKTTILCKDTPAFVANRIGVFSIMYLFKVVDEMGLSVEWVDKMTGPLVGRPKSATFRTCDVVGIDTLIKVANGLQLTAPNDEYIDCFKLPAFLQKIADNNWFGDKSGQGFYKKTVAGGKKEIWSLDLKTFEYRPQEKVKLPILEQLKAIDDAKTRIITLANSPDQAGEFFRKTMAAVFSYSSLRVPEISDSLSQIDDAMRAGFGWEFGPFEIWDMLGIDKGLLLCSMYGMPVAPWVKDLKNASINRFYAKADGKKTCIQAGTTNYQQVAGTQGFIFLDTLQPENIVYKNSGATITDLGDGILNVSFHSKMNAIGGEQIQAIHKAIDLAEKEHRGVVIANESANFSAGANLAMVFMMAIEQEYDELDFAIRNFQQTSMRIRYSSVPVVVAPRGLTLGGGCEFSLHADHIQAAAETYIGLVELGVGVIPGGGGTKEFALRISDQAATGDVELNRLQETFMHIAMAKVATSAVEARNMGILRPQDGISLHLDRQIADAKAACIRLAEQAYTQPLMRNDIRVLGRSGIALFKAGLNNMRLGNYISDHDRKIADKLAYVICGGDLTSPQLVSEQYLLDLEREAFLSLCGERKTLERIEAVLKTGKPLRN